MVKSLPAVRETQVRSLVQEDPLEKEMATHSRILDGRMLEESDTTELLYFTSLLPPQASRCSAVLLLMGG